MTVWVFASYSPSVVSTQYLTLTKQQRITFTVLPSAVHKGCYLTGPQPIKKAMKHSNITPISPKGPKCLLDQARIAKIWISSSWPQRSFTALVMSCVGHSPNTHPKNQSNCIYFNCIDKLHESNSVLHLFSQWYRHGHVNFLWKGKVESSLAFWVWKNITAG